MASRPAGDAPSDVTPHEALQIAERYAKHPWQPFARNILHAEDPDGIMVQTPDIGYRPDDGRIGWWIPGESNYGIPYKWGGFDDPARFDQGIARGAAAGDVSSPEKRRADDAAVSTHAVGLDCSGYISRCLKLPTVHDTADLPKVCDPLPSADALLPSDLLNIPRRHVMLVAGWSEDREWIYYYETGGLPDHWRPGLKKAPISELLALGFQPLRYRGMRSVPLPPEREILTRSQRLEAAVVPKPEIGAP